MHTYTFCVNMSKRKRMIIYIASEGHEISICFNKVLAAFFFDFPNIFRNYIPFLSRKITIQTGCYIMSEHCTLNKHCAAAAKRIIQSVIMAQF